MDKKPWADKSAIIVDDSESVRAEFKKIFERCQIKVSGVAENGLVALDLIHRLQPDIVSLDIIMPEMDGIECYRKIQIMYPHIKCIVISWLAHDSKVHEGLRSVIPHQLFQSKPLTPSDLETRLQKIFMPENPVTVAKVKEGPDNESLFNAIGDEDFGDLGVKVS